MFTRICLLRVRVLPSLCAIAIIQHCLAFSAGITRSGKRDGTPVEAFPRWHDTQRITRSAKRVGKPVEESLGRHDTRRTMRSKKLVGTPVEASPSRHGNGTTKSVLRQSITVYAVEPQRELLIDTVKPQRARRERAVWRLALDESGASVESSESSESSEGEAQVADQSHQLQREGDVVRRSVGLVAVVDLHHVGLLSALLAVVLMIALLILLQFIWRAASPPSASAVPTASFLPRSPALARWQGACLRALAFSAPASADGAPAARAPAQRKADQVSAVKVGTSEEEADTTDALPETTDKVVKSARSSRGRTGKMTHVEAVVVISKAVRKYLQWKHRVLKDAGDIMYVVSDARFQQGEHQGDSDTSSMQEF